MVVMDNKLLISGDNLLHALEYIKRRKGLEGLNWIVCDTGCDMESIYPEKMYPFEIYIQILEVIKANFEYTDSTIISRIGFDRAKTLTFFESYKNKTDPITIFNLMKKHWYRFNDFGRFEVKESGDFSASIYLCDYPGNSLYCQCMRGFLKGIISAVCNMKDVKVEEVKCLGEGDRYCKFETSWRNPGRAE